MKKVLAVLAIIGMVTAPAFAQEIKEASGMVDSINPIDPARGDYEGGIILRDTGSNIKRFGITTTTVISDQVTGKIDSADIQDGDKVKVTYSGSGQVPAAITISRSAK